MILQHVMSAGPSSFSSASPEAYLDYIPGPHVEYDFEWDSGNTTWGESALHDTLWDDVRYFYRTPIGHYTIHGCNSKGKYTHRDKHYWLEAGGTCGMWLEDDNKTYTEWWDEIESTTPWDKGITPWDTTNSIDTTWDIAGTGRYERAYWYDFIPIGIFITQGGDAGRGYSLQPQVGEFHLEFTDIVYDNLGKRTNCGSFTLTGNSKTELILSQTRGADKGSFVLSGGNSSGIYDPKGVVDYILNARPVPDDIEVLGDWDNGTTIWEESINGTITLTEWWDDVIDQSISTFNLNGGESKGKYREGGCVRNPTDWDQHNLNNTEWDQHNYRETWWDTHKLRCLEPQPGVFTLTGQEAYYDDYAHLTTINGAFLLNAGQEVEWDNLTTIWQEDDLITDTYWYDGESQIANFARTAYSGVGEFICTASKVGERESFNLTANHGSFVVTPEDTTLTNNKIYSIAVGTATYNISGQAYAAIDFNANPASYSVSGSSVGYQTNILSKVEAGVFNLQGQEALSTVNYTLLAERESYAITGWMTNTTLGIGADSAEFIVSTQDTAIESTLNLRASAGNFTVSSETIGRGYKLPLDSSSFTVTGYESNIHQVINFTRGQFSVEVSDAGRNRHLTVKVDGAGPFLLEGQEATFTTVGSTVTPANFDVAGSSIESHVTVIRSVEPAHYTLTGNNSDYDFTARPVVRTGIFVLDFEPFTVLTWNKATVSNFATGNFNVTGNHTLEEGKANIRLSAGTGEFSVSYDCDSRAFSVEAGEFTLTGNQVFFNSDKHTLTAGPNAEFVVELQTVGRYGDHNYNKTAEYVFTGSPVSFLCGDYTFSNWDSYNTNWDVFKTYWDKKYGADKPCPVRPATVIPATFTVDTVEIGSYTNQKTVVTEEVTRAFPAIEPDFEWDDGSTTWGTPVYDTYWDVATHLRARAGNFVATLETLSYYNYTIHNEGVFEVVGCSVGATIYKNPAVEWDDDLTKWEEMEGNNVVDTLWYDDDSLGVPSPIDETVYGKSEAGHFVLNGEETEGDHWEKPANVYLMADYLHLKIEEGCHGVTETFWDKQKGTKWVDTYYGETDWYATDITQDVISWDEDECKPVTNWDNHKSRWDRGRCTVLGVDYHMTINCK